MTRSSSPKPHAWSKNLLSMMQCERSSADLQLEVELRGLEAKIAQARRDIVNGERIDSHMMHNAGMIGPLIAKRNLMLELLPLAEVAAKDEVLEEPVRNQTMKSAGKR